MAVGWYICNYAIRPEGWRARYCTMDDFTEQIRADGGDWREIEIRSPPGGLGRALVKVSGASAATLSTINATPGFIRLPLDSLNAPLSDLTNAQRNALRQRLLDSGFTVDELTTAFPNLVDVRLVHILRLWAKHHRETRLTDTGEIVADGPLVLGVSPTEIDYYLPDS